MLISYGVPPLGGVKQGSGGKTSYFRAKCVNISKTVGDTVTIAGHLTGHSRCRYLKGRFCLELIRAVNQFC